MNSENLTPFQPGESGNPSGRPRGAKNLSTILKELLETDVEIDGGEKHPYKNAIVTKLLQKAAKGDIKAIQEIFDRTEGKAKQEIKHDGLVNTPMQVEIIKSDDSAA